MSPEAEAIVNSARTLGIKPEDLATVISYETGGKFSPSIMGGKGGNYLGLIQFGPSERKQYGASPDQSFTEQMGAVTRYLQDRGLKPGMGIHDLYSTINAGRPGLYNASDSPGQTVNTHVDNMLENHYPKAVSFLGGEISPVTPDGTAALPTAATSPVSDAADRMVARNAGILQPTTPVGATTGAAPPDAAKQQPLDTGGLKDLVSGLSGPKSSGSVADPSIDMRPLQALEASDVQRMQMAQQMMQQLLMKQGGGLLRRPVVPSTLMGMRR
jgi:hypothetical protein